MTCTNTIFLKTPLAHARALVLSCIALLTPTLSYAADKITVGVLRLQSHASSFIAHERGYFKAEGLDVTLMYFEAAQPMAVAIASGDVNFGMTAITGGLINLAEKGAVKVIGGALQEDPNVEGQAILVSKKAYDEGITSPAKLRGRSFGVTQAGSSFHYMAYKIAQKEGFPPSEIAIKPLQKVPSIVAALRSGQIDAWSIQPNNARELEAGGDVKIIGRVGDYAPGYQVTTVFTSAKIAAEKRDLVKRFLSGLSKGVADYNAALVDKSAGAVAADDIAKLLQPFVFPDQPLEKVAGSIRNGAMRLNKNASLNLASVKDQLAWFQEQGMVAKSITLEQFVDTSFVEVQ
jgi:NitT/TauT family transport system substrate-binding protein